MTSYQIIEQLIADRRADLARSWPRQAGAPRWGRGFTLRRRAGSALSRTDVAPHSLPAAPFDGVGFPDVVRKRAPGGLLTLPASASDARQGAFDDAA
jgi:hypothetical protein